MEWSDTKFKIVDLKLTPHIQKTRNFFSQALQAFENSHDSHTHFQANKTMRHHFSFAFQDQCTKKKILLMVAPGMVLRVADCSDYRIDFHKNHDDFIKYFNYSHLSEMRWCPQTNQITLPALSVHFWIPCSIKTKNFTTNQKMNVLLWISLGPNCTGKIQIPLYKRQDVN